MPPPLLLDVHLSHVVADGLNRRGFDVVAAAREVSLRELDDAALLIEACRRKRGVVTYNIRDFAPLSREWAASERQHWGIVLIHARTIAQSDLSAQLRALEGLLRAMPDDGLRDQTVFLVPGGSRRLDV